SRRRHTRFSRDWSSDVCSSDLERTFSVIEDAFFPIIILSYTINQDNPAISAIASKTASIAEKAFPRRNLSKNLARGYKDIEIRRSEERRVGRECRNGERERA